MLPIYHITLYILLLSISPRYSSLHQCSTQCAIVNCPMGQDCNIKCYYYNTNYNVTEYGQQICMQIIINATIGNTSYFPWPRTLQCVQIHCPNDNNNDNEDVINEDGLYKPCQIYCNADDLMRRVTINAMEGMNDLHIESINYNKKCCIRGANLNCGDINCPLTNGPSFGCQDPLSNTVDQRCETYVIGPNCMNPSISSTESLRNTENTNNPVPISHMNELDENNGLTDGETVTVILIPLLFCTLILIGIGCYKMRKSDNYGHNNDDRNSHRAGFDGDKTNETNPEIYGKDKNKKKKINDNKENDARLFTLFENQVSGSLPMLYSDGHLYKPLKTDLEKKFYENIFEWIPSIKPFIAKYSGMEYINIKTDDNENNNNNNNNNIDDGSDIDNNLTNIDIENIEDMTINPWSHQLYKKNKHKIGKMAFLILEDVTIKYNKPCILDLKIGTRHFAPICKSNKMSRKLKKAWCSTCKDFGVRIGGIHLYDNKKGEYEIMAKDIGRILEKNTFCDKLIQFFKNKTNLNVFITKLNTLYDILKNENRFRWFSCSLLFVYEGYDDNIKHQKDVKNKQDSEHKMDGDIDTKQFDPERSDLRLIDFTNFVVVENYSEELFKNKKEEEQDEESDDDTDQEQFDDEEEDKNGGNYEVLQLIKDLDNLNEPDHGILFGLEALIKLLAELYKTGTIQRRNDNEWNEFRDSISWSKMALTPFKNKNIFNENTTIQ